MTKIGCIIIVTLLTFSSRVYASDTTELSIDSGSCWLKERGVVVKDNPISIQGKKTERGCIAFILDKEFDKRYKFCAYSGFDITRGGTDFYGCSYTREKNSYMFRAYMDENNPAGSGILCSFMCYKK